MARALKLMLIAGYEKDLGGANNLILVDPGPMTVETNRAFRRDLRDLDPRRQDLGDDKPGHRRKPKYNHNGIEYPMSHDDLHGGRTTHRRRRYCYGSNPGRAGQNPIGDRVFNGRRTIYWRALN